MKSIYNFQPSFFLCAPCLSFFFTSQAIEQYVGPFFLIFQRFESNQFHRPMCVANGLALNCFFHPFYGVIII